MNFCIQSLYIVTFMTKQNFWFDITNQKICFIIMATYQEWISTLQSIYIVTVMTKHNFWFVITAACKGKMSQQAGQILNALSSMYRDHDDEAKIYECIPEYMGPWWRIKKFASSSWLHIKNEFLRYDLYI